MRDHPELICGTQLFGIVELIRQTKIVNPFIDEQHQHEF